MSDVQDFKISTKESQDLLKEIQDELPRTNRRPKDSNGNREYEPNKDIDTKVRQLLVSLQLGVR